MDRNQIEDYLKKLKDIEENLTSEDNFDVNFVNEIDNVLTSLSEDMSESMKPFTTQNNDDLLPGGSILVKVKRLHNNAVIPSYSKIGDAGMDLTAVDIEETVDYVSYKTGLAFEIPKGHVGLLFPRSSNSKKDLLLTNSVGVIDSGYRGEVELRYKRIKADFADNVKKYEIGDRVGQIMILPYPNVYMTEVPELSDSQRGTGGFGSTGK